MRIELVTPTQLSSDPAAVHILVDALTGADLGFPDAGFADPAPALRGGRQLQFLHLRGVRKSPQSQPASLPDAPLTALAATTAPMAFLLSSNGREASIAVGTAAPHDRQLLTSLQALLGGPPPAPISVDHLLRDWQSTGCLVGLPETPSPRPEGTRLSTSPADLLLDTLHGTPFLWVVLATPEPTDRVEAQIAHARSLVEEIERTHLQLGEQSNIERAALKAKALLDRTLEQLEVGRCGQLWRTAVVLCTPAPHLTAQGLGLVAGSLSNPTSSSTLLPLRGHLCSNRKDGLSIFTNLLSSRQLSELCPLPGRDRAGFARLLEVDFDVDHRTTDDDIPLGPILDRRRLTKTTFGISPDQLTRHVLVAGHTGAGKTTTVKRLLTELSSRGIPFLVLEPAKREYRQLAASVPDLTILSAGHPPEEGRLPFLLNPFAFPEGFPLHTHIDFLRTAFVSSFGFTPPTPYLLESALVKIYERRGWNVILGSHPLAPDPLCYPTLDDLLQVVEEIVSAAGYDTEITRNLRGALRTRIGSLCSGPKGFSLNTSLGLPDRLLFDTPLIVELADFGADDEKAFVMSLLLTRLFETREVADPGGGHFRHLLVIEEAHRLLGRVAERPGEEGNMRHQAVQAFANLLAELRAYGQGVVAVEQIPTKLTPEVVKLAGSKIIHRLLPEDDRELVGSAMSLFANQRSALSNLPTGHAVCRSEGMDGAIRVRVNRNETPQSSPVTKGSRNTSTLPANELSRIDELVRLAAAKTVFSQVEVVRQADGVVALLVASERSQPAVDGLRKALARALAVGPQRVPSESGQLQTVYRFALEEALLRRVVAFGWSLPDADRLRALIPDDLEQLGTELRRRRAKVLGPHALCDQCPHPCLWQYEGARLANEAHTEDEVADVIDGADGDVSLRLRETLTRATERLLGPSAALVASGPSYCALTHLVTRWDLSQRASTSVLKLMKEEEPSA